MDNYSGIPGLTLTDRQVRVFEALCGDRPVPCGTLAAEIGVSRSRIYQIRARVRRKIDRALAMHKAREQRIAWELARRQRYQDTIRSEPELLELRVDALEWSVRCRNAFAAEEIVFVGDLVWKSEADLLRLPNFGRKSLNEVKEVLAQIGLMLAAP